MSIRELSKEVSSKIAAGEVVERPLSVVKELIENSIDAGAKEISIRVNDAGRGLIEVEDDGEGIISSEVQLAVRRYATSKISDIDDLQQIHSLGFRGEALASIAAVSRFSIETKSIREENGIAVTFEAGEKITQTKFARKQGTSIRVENLFYNVPARLKFLKKDITEKKIIAELISSYAVYYCHIRFSLIMDDRKVITSYGRGDRREILSEKYDLETARRLLEVDHSGAGIKIKGFTSPTSITRSNRNEIRFFVNGRLVSDPSLMSAVLRAYHGLLMTGRFPISILFLEIVPEDIDVNVHPTKAEIRFKDQGMVFSFVHSAVRKVISAFSPVPSFSTDIWSSNNQFEKQIDPAWKFAAQDIAGEPVIQGNTREGASIEEPLKKIPLLRVVGQIGRLYIAAEGPDGLYLIDQHAAHERVLYEQMMNKSSSSTVSQMLLNPEVIHLNSIEMDNFVLNKELLEGIGFNIEEFGPDAIKVNALPMTILHLSPEDAVLGALEKDEEDRGIVDEELEKKMITKICKRAAVKGGQILSQQEQEKLIRELENCASPRTCPHGRPTMIHLSVNMLANQFGRLGSR